ncbi:MAG: hypothetical protein ACRBFS_04140 [Aureispira sp.]
MRSYIFLLFFLLLFVFYKRNASSQVVAFSYNKESVSSDSCIKHTQIIKQDWGTLQLDCLGAISDKGKQYEVFFITRRVDLIEGQKASLFLIFEGKETYSYLVEEQLGLEYCLESGQLWIGAEDCLVDFSEIGEELLCPNCTTFSCTFLDYNPLKGIETDK